MKNNSKSAFTLYKRMHESGEFSSLYTYIHSLMTGVSVAFFIGLFSAGPIAISCSISLLISTILFSVAIALNTVFSTYFLFFRNDRRITFELFAYSKWINYLSNVSVSLPFIAFSFLFFYFSNVVGSIFVFSLVIIVVLAFCIFKEMEKNIDKAFKAKLEIEDISELEEFKKIHELPVFSNSELREMSLEFGLLSLLKIRLVDFLDKNNFDKESVDLLRLELINALINICKTKAGDSGLNLLMKKAIAYFGESDLSENKVKEHINEIIFKIDYTGSYKFLI